MTKLLVIRVNDNFITYAWQLNSKDPDDPHTSKLISRKKKKKNPIVFFGGFPPPNEVVHMFISFVLSPSHFQKKPKAVSWGEKKYDVVNLMWPYGLDCR